jgi:predicted O-linked N-acetylglucosamine transferase (SPINDLY family)
LAFRPAPIQVNYLGYPGTMGADFIDYVIADKIVLPFDQQPHYAEKIVHLPECYQVNDSQRRIDSRTPSRRELGLPESAFVFCCFNNNFKITAPFFDVWMRLLKAVDGSVLWLLRDSESAEKNIRCGYTFAGRVAASLLSGVGLPELVTYNLGDYEVLALRLAQDSALLAGLRAKLVHNRDSCPLFDSKRFTRHLEAAYATMWHIWQRGEKPRSFSVAPQQGSSGSAW